MTNPPGFFPPGFFPPGYMPGPPGHIPGFHVPGTLTPIAAVVRQQAEAVAAVQFAAQTQAAEQARKKRRDHLLMYRR